MKIIDTNKVGFEDDLFSAVKNVRSIKVRKKMREIGKKEIGKKGALFLVRDILEHFNANVNG